MSNNQNGPFGPPPGGGGWGPPGGAPPPDQPQQGYPPAPQQGYAPPPQQGYAPPPQQGYAPPPQQAYPMQQQQQGYPPQQGYAPPQGYPAQQAYPMQPQGYPGQPPPGYGHAPINIVVQNTHNAGGFGGGLVRVGNKSRMNAALFAFFLGGLGAHKFYLGRTGLGILYLVFCVTTIPSMIAFVEGILFLMMSDHDFDLKYNSALTR